MALIAAITLIVVVGLDRIPQNPEYHDFSDSIGYFWLPNALNVLSNIPFVVVGTYGLVWLFQNRANSLSIVKSNEIAYWIFFGGTTLVGLGSGYYHIAPNNETLVWDRLPMTVAFMAFYAIILCEFVSEKWFRLVVFPLLFFGVLSVFYWWISESQGVGDLRYYAVVQFFPMLTIPIILLFFKPKFTLVSGYWVLLASYMLAKLLEHFDSQFHELFGIVSGHSIKHVLPAVGILYLLHIYKTRKLVTLRPDHVN